jgi:tRNA(fMet)-specific endonuclease VapC
VTSRVSATAILLDTDVYSYVARGDPRGAKYQPYLKNRTLCLSFATVAELYKGAYKAGWGTARIGQMEAHLRNFVVLPFDHELSRVCGEPMATAERAGRRMHEFDAWIAATAIRHGLPLATNNTKDFIDIPGLALVP